MKHSDRARRAGAETEIRRLRRSVEVLLDGDLVLPADGRELLALLDAALQHLAAGDTPTARTGMQRFIERAQSLIQAGVLEARAGDPPLETAGAILASLHG